MKIKQFEIARSIFCIIVVIHHFMMVFCYQNQIFIYNDGNLAVMYFLVLAGVVMPIKFYLNDDNKIGNERWYISVMRYGKRRYLRLLPVALVSLFFAYFLMSLGGVLC